MCPSAQGESTATTTFPVGFDMRHNRSSTANVKDIRTFQSKGRAHIKKHIPILELTTRLCISRNGLSLSVSYGSHCANAQVENMEFLGVAGSKTPCVLSGSMRRNGTTNLRPAAKISRHD